MRVGCFEVFQQNVASQCPIPDQKAIQSIPNCGGDGIVLFAGMCDMVIYSMKSSFKNIKDTKCCTLKKKDSTVIVEFNLTGQNGLYSFIYIRFQKSFQGHWHVIV